MKVVIAGGGIGGLSTAVALALEGWRVEVLERAPEFAEVGAGLQISPNGMRVLDYLGITPLIEGALFEPECLEVRLGDRSRRVFKITLKGTAKRRWGNRFIQIHRGDLHDALQKRARELGVVIRTGVEVTGYVRESNGAAVYINGQERIYGDLVIGADGIKSAIRAQMTGTDRARFTGNVAWRITLPLDAVADNDIPEGGCVWVGGGKHAVTTRIKGGQLVNFIGIVKQTDWQEEGWTIKGTREEALADFGDWDPLLNDIIIGAEDLYRWALFDRPPLVKWSDGPVVLLGDAAHPMLPSMAQGAVQALEDAVILAKVLRENSSIDTALTMFRDTRFERTTQICKRSAGNLDLFHTSGGLSQFIKFAPIWLAGQMSENLIHKQQDWIYGYDPLNP